MRPVPLMTELIIVVRIPAVAVESKFAGCDMVMPLVAANVQLVSFALPLMALPPLNVRAVNVQTPPFVVPFQIKRPPVPAPVPSVKDAPAKVKLPVVAGVRMSKADAVVYVFAADGAWALL